MISNFLVRSRIDAVMKKITRKTGCLLLSVCLAAGPVGAGPMKFLEAVDKAMKDYATDLQAEGDANLNTIKTIGGKLMHPTKWKELGTDIDAGMKAYGDALTKTGDNALANTKAMMKLLLSVRTYVPEFILKMWDKLVAALHGAGGQVSEAAGSSWADDGSLPAGGGGSDQPFADSGDVPQASEIRASGTRRPAGKKLSVSDRDSALKAWIDMRTAAAGLWKLSKQAKPEGKAKVEAAMHETIKDVRSHDPAMMGHLVVNPKATLAFATMLDRGSDDERAAMGDVIGALNRAYTDKMRNPKASSDVKAAAAAVAKLKKR